MAVIIIPGDSADKSQRGAEREGEGRIPGRLGDDSRKSPKETNGIKNSSCRGVLQRLTTCASGTFKLNT
jgi:hypothetical protein